MKTYPFNWPEFHAWKNSQPKRYVGNGKQTNFKTEFKVYEIQDTQDVSRYISAIHGLPVWPLIPLPTDKGSAERGPKRAGCILAACCLSLALLTAPAQAAQYDIGDRITVPFGATVVNTVTPATAEQMGCVLNEDETEWEC